MSAPNQRNPRLPGRSPAAAEADDPFPVQPPGDLPARADLERLRRQRQAALRGASPSPTLLAEDPELRIWIEADANAGHAHDPRQRHRHDARGGHRASRHHRPLRHRRVLQEALGRPAEGFAAHRPVRRGLLFGVHRRGPRRGAHAQGRRAGRRRRALGVERRRRIHRRDRRARASAAPPSSLHLKEDAKEFARRLAAALADPPLLRPHRLPGAHAARKARRRSNTRPSTRRRRCGRGRESEIKDEEYKQFYQHVSHDYAASRWPGATTGSRASASTRACSTSPARAPFDLWQRDARARAEALREARVHHGRRRAVPAAVPALRERRASIRPTCRSTCRASCCRTTGSRGHARRAHASACSTCWPSSPRTSRRSTRPSGSEFGAVLKEGLAEDRANRDKLLPLLRFASTHEAGQRADGEPRWQTTSSRMQTGQEQIYYVIAR